jgi:hypothetical protein
MIEMRYMYKILLVTTDGKSFVTDFHKSKSVSEAWKSDLNSGSRWFFYPLHFVIVDKANIISCKNTLLRQRVIDVPYFYSMFEEFKGSTIASLLQFIKENKAEIERLIMNELV